MLHNNRSLRCLLVAGLIAVALPAIGEACAVCFGGVDSPLTKGMNNGILSLLGILGLVQVGFAALFLKFRQRSRQLGKLKEASETFRMIDGGAS